MTLANIDIHNVIVETIWLWCPQGQTANTSPSDFGATWIDWLYLGPELPTIINIWIMSDDKDFLTSLLICWRLICQQIRSNIWGTDVNNRRFSIKYYWKGTWNRERPIWNIRNHIMFNFLFNTRNPNSLTDTIYSLVNSYLLTIVSAIAITSLWSL